MKKPVSFILVLLIILPFILTGCSNDSDKLPDTVDGYNNSKYTIAVEVGTITEERAKAALPKASFVYVNSASDGYLAVKSGTADAYAGDKNVFLNAETSGIEGLKYIDENIGDSGNIAVGISPKSEISDAEGLINGFIKQITSDGTIEDMYQRWITDSNYDMPNIEEPENPKMQINIGTTGLLEPYSFYYNNALSGLDIELAKRFALYADAKIVITTYDWTSIITACASGKIDYAISSLFETKERKESIGFSNKYLMLNTVLIVPDEGASPAKYSNVEDFNGAVIGSQTGTMFDKILEGSISNLKFKYYDDINSQILALKTGDVDAVGLDEPVAKLAVAENSDLAVFPTVIQTDNYGLPMKKGGELTDRVSNIIAQYKSDGTIDKLKNKWFSGDDSLMKIDMSEYSNYDTSNGVLRFIHDSTQVPMAYVNDAGESEGFEVELVLMIGKALGMQVDITQANFSSLITAVSSGSADIAAGCISITDERRESVDFPMSHYTGGIELLCRKSDLVSSASSAAVSSLKDLNGKKFGVLTGSAFDAMTSENFTDADITYYNTTSDLCQALKTKKIDTFLMDQPVAEHIHKTDSDISYLSETVINENYGFMFTKTDNGEKLRDQFNEYLAGIKDSGEYDKLISIWMGSDESKKNNCIH